MSTHDFEVVTRHIVMERDLNSFGNLFGGVMLAWLDEAAALFVMEKTGWEAPGARPCNLNNRRLRGRVFV